MTSYWTEQLEYVEQFVVLLTQVEAVNQKQEKVKVVLVATVGMVVKEEEVVKWED